MDIGVQYPTFAARKLIVKTGGLWAGPKLMVEGRVVEGKRGSYQVSDDVGNIRNVKLKYSMFDPVPGVEIDGEKICLARPLAWYEYAWMGIPLLLVFSGGAMGAALGVSAIYSSSRIFRSERSMAAKYALSGLVSVGAAVAFIVLATAIRILIFGVKTQ